jgi:uncharacterized protein (TIGR00661 family)
MDWGIGHATRLVPLIRELREQQCEILLASSGNALAFFRNYFPELISISKPGYNVKYSSGKLSFSIFTQLPKIISAIFREHKWLKKIIKEHKITEVISDNCFGLYSKEISCTFITHQVNIKIPEGLFFFDRMINKINRLFIKKYNQCFVPDFENGDINLSGNLSHGKNIPSNVKYIWPLSRFKNISKDIASTGYDIVILLSGPEPQRTILEDKCFRFLNESELRCCFIRGLPANNSSKVNSANITWFNHLPDENFAGILKNSKKIICRSGYSTIMDLTELNVKATLVPTPGQTEQEYLAGHNSGKGFEYLKQENITEEILLRKEYLTAENPHDYLTACSAR